MWDESHREALERARGAARRAFWMTTCLSHQDGAIDSTASSCAACKEAGAVAAGEAYASALGASPAPEPDENDPFFKYHLAESQPRDDEITDGVSWGASRRAAGYYEWMRRGDPARPPHNLMHLAIVLARKTDSGVRPISGEPDRLRAELELAATRMEILVDRMRGCGNHELLDEAESFVRDARVAARLRSEGGAT